MGKTEKNFIEKTCQMQTSYVKGFKT